MNPMRHQFVSRVRNKATQPDPDVRCKELRSCKLIMVHFNSVNNCGGRSFHRSKVINPLQVGIPQLVADIDAQRADPVALPASGPKGRERAVAAQSGG